MYSVLEALYKLFDRISLYKNQLCLNSFIDYEVMLSIILAVFVGISFLFVTDNNKSFENPNKAIMDTEPLKLLSSKERNNVYNLNREFMNILGLLIIVIGIIFNLFLLDVGFHDENLTIKMIFLFKAYFSFTMIYSIGLIIRKYVCGILIMRNIENKFPSNPN
ncbi:MAG TPA: hypothetical protein VIH13_02760 [Candidatus Hydromicrobium sp.]